MHVCTHLCTHLYAHLYMSTHMSYTHVYAHVDTQAAEIAQRFATEVAKQQQQQQQHARSPSTSGHDRSTSDFVGPHRATSRSWRRGMAAEAVAEAEIQAGVTLPEDMFQETAITI